MSERLLTHAPEVGEGEVANKDTPPLDSAVGYRSVVGGFFIQFVIFGNLAAFPAFIGAFEHDSSLGRPTRTQLSLVNSVASGPGLIAGVFGGYVLDRVGARPVLVLNAALFLFALLATSFFAESYQQMIGLYSIATTITIGLSNAPVTAVISSWFDRRLSLAMGIAVAGGGVGSAVLPAISGALLTTFSNDWRTVWKIFAIFGVLLIVAVLLLQPRVTPSQAAHRQHRKSLKEACREMRVALSYCLTVHFLSIFGVGALFGLVYTASLFLVMPFALDFGKEGTPYAAETKISVASAGWLYTGFGLAQTVGSFALGPLGDMLGPRHVLALSLVIGSLGCGWLAASRTYASIFLAFALAGFAFAGCWAMIPSLLTRAFSGPHLGLIMGFGYVAIGIGALIGPPSCSLIADYPLSYEGSFIYLAVLCQVGGLLSLLIPLGSPIEPSGQQDGNSNPTAVVNCPP